MSDFMTIEGRSHIQLDENFSQNAKVKVIGVGGAGGNALNRMKEMNIQNVEFIAINTDALALDHSLADDKIAIGKETTKNLGAGARPEVGRKAILEDSNAVEEKLKGADMVFIAAGMGGGTGTGAAPVVAEIARKLGILTVAVVSMPFQWEGPVRRRNAKNGMAALKEMVDSIIVIDNQSIFKIIDKNTTTNQAFLVVDEVLGDAVRGVVDIIMRPGTINIDFQDIRRIMENGGKALMGTGVAEGEDRALKAAEAAITCPLLGDVNVNGASGVLVNISHSENFGMFEMQAAMDFISQAVGIDSDDDEGVEEIIFGDCILPELGEKVAITVFATKFFGEIRETPALASPIHVETPIVRAAQPVQQPVHPAPQNVAPVAPISQAPAVQAPTQSVHAAPAQQTSFTGNVPHRESFMPPKTANFLNLMNQPHEEPAANSVATQLTTNQFTGFARTQDIRAVSAVQEEVFAPAAHSHIAAQQVQQPAFQQTTCQQPTFNTQQAAQFQAPALNDKPSFAEQPTLSQPALGGFDSVAGGLDLSNPPTSSFSKSDTRTMESYRGGFMDGADF